MMPVFSMQPVSKVPIVQSNPACWPLKPVLMHLPKECQHDELTAYPEAFKASWLHEELHLSRNFKPWMAKGLKLGSLMFGIDQMVWW